MFDPKDVYRFGHSSHWLTNCDYETRLSEILTDELKPVASAFLANMMRVRSLGGLVPDMAYWIRIMVRIGDVAKVRLGREIELPGRVRGAAPADAEFQRKFEAAFDEWTTMAPLSGEAWRDGCDLMRSIVDADPQRHGLGLETLMSAELLETWSAVEAMVSDIWVVALNISPEPLAANYLGSEKSFPVQILRKFDFNVSNKMGEIITSMNKVDMNSLSGIRSAYKSAFSDSNTDEIFAKFDPDVSHLEAIRNLFAHRSGVVDQKFLSRVQKSEIIPRYEIGDRFAIKGEIVSFYIEKSVQFATELFIFVDRWLFANRPLNN
ncbi:hypothetical protein [Sphingomonas yabuuchiae]|uniref:hypothetical protein n=1 Tax=Sphingomonas yabuuchiae TaxID=172044 RepID=UPI000A72C30A|nr:hypothetical protein [Sphingomonas yabuuchiae]